MKKSILNLGKALEKKAQKQINGGGKACNYNAYPDFGCRPGSCCSRGQCIKIGSALCAAAV
ncbi:hypothetical protein [Tenacibaculum sp. 190524A02b]|uniref:hypothetical protein n=1 Tax=Tenacibaculum vairaonense TaxID=3137860 RepID=UPI0031FA8CB1